MDEQNASTKFAADMANIEREISEVKRQHRQLQHELEEKEYSYRQLSRKRESWISSLHTMRADFERETSIFHSTGVLAGASAFILEELRHNAEQQNACSSEQLSRMKADVLRTSDKVAALAAHLRYLEEKKLALRKNCP